ncbi:hypothetical protein Tsubulata_003067 [Turnera subulata]|uniref:Uncharacterized protein n=1 Tax=Turnera subulata TaxID=218843 RepID=A0A9Q0FSV4_9ROSI|nr:hypothetical protein Tsubulata_003067 [Turnera subulata]
MKCQDALLEVVLEPSALGNSATMQLKVWKRIKDWATGEDVDALEYLIKGENKKIIKELTHVITDTPDENTQKAYGLLGRLLTFVESVRVPQKAPPKNHFHFLGRFAFSVGGPLMALSSFALAGLGYAEVIDRKRMAEDFADRIMEVEESKKRLQKELDAMKEQIQKEKEEALLKENEALKVQIQKDKEKKEKKLEEEK